MRRIFLFMAIILCLAGYAYAASDVTYDILNYYPLTSGYSWENTDGYHKKIVDYGQINGHNAVEVTKWYPGNSPLASNVMYYDEDYLYVYSYHNKEADVVWVYDPFFKLKRKISVGETIGNDFNLHRGETNLPYTYSRTLIAVEDVTTPAGEFKDCLKFSRVMNGATTYEWWALNVGVVKATGAEEYEVASYNFGSNNNCYCPPSQDSTFNMESYVLHIPVVTIEGLEGAKYELDLKLSGSSFELINIQAIGN